MSKTRIPVFLTVFGLMNLAFVPLLSFYGLRVCPVLSIPGFGFGCYYTGLYVGLILILNGVLLGLFAKGDISRGLLARLSKHFILTMAGVYLLATAAALVTLQMLLHLNHLSTHSRGPEILLLASLLIGVTQGYGAIWAFRGHPVMQQAAQIGTFRENWFKHILRTMFPIVIVVAVLLHFMIGQSISFNDGRTAPVAANDEFIRQASFLIFSLLAWLAVTFTFHFLSERDQIATVQGHLEKMSNPTNLKFRSETAGSWGLWRSIIVQLNLFAQALEERGRLLSAFSKFVTVGMANEVLSKDRLLTTSGETREMTVLMIDIRDFTAMSEKLNPSQVVMLLNEYFSAMLAAIAMHPVTVDKFIGDGILAYIEPGASPDDENTTAITAALQMVNSIEGLNGSLLTQGLPAIKIGVGVYRGPLVIGLIGTQNKMQHTIIGDTVNRVSRLESLCKETGVSIILSQSIWKSLPVDLQKQFSSFGSRIVKGIVEPIDIFGGPSTN